MTMSIWRKIAMGVCAAVLVAFGSVKAQDGLAGDLDDLLGLGGAAAPAQDADEQKAEPGAEADPAAAQEAVAEEVEAAQEVVAEEVEAAQDAVAEEVEAAQEVVAEEVVEAREEALEVVVENGEEAPAAPVPEMDANVDVADLLVPEAGMDVEPEAEVAEAPDMEQTADDAVEAGPEGAGAPSAVISEIETLERLRRRALEEHGRTSLLNARESLRTGDYPEARRLYEEALKFIGARPGNEELRNEAEQGVAEAIYRQAGVLWKKGDRERAIQLARQARERNHPKAPRMVAELQEEIDNPPEPPAPKDPKRWNTEDYRKERETAAKSIAKAREYYITGEYSKARTELELVLRDNPYDVDALNMLKRVNERTFDVSTAERDTTRSQMIRDVRNTWNPRRYAIDTVQLGARAGAATEGRPVSQDGRTIEQATLDKMRNITIPEINFRAANINDVISFFETASREFDNPELPPDQRGVSFVLKLSGGSAPEAPAIDDPFAPAAATKGAGGISPITFSARYVTLFDALNIVTDVAGLKFRVRGPVVMVMPLNVPETDMITRSYTVLPSLNERAMGVSREMGGAAGGRGGDMGFMAVAEVQDTGRVDWKEFFQEMGVSWPDGSSISYIQSISKLRVLNTPENLATLEQLLEELNVTPRQIEIEARFVEVSQTDLESVGFEWLLTDDWELAHKEGAASLASAERLQVSSGSGTRGRLRYLNSPDVSANIGGAVADNVLEIASVLTNPELTFILHLLSQRQNTDLLSAPKVVTKNNQEAVIKVVTEYIYPTEFDVETIETSVVDGSTTRTAPTAGLVEPGSFETREVGVILQVLPEVSPDGQMIDLFLRPQIVSEPEWKNYGTTYSDASGFTYSLNMEQPFFKVRSIETRISIYNGATVVMGGMITEVRTEIDDKIPVIGDIPLIGRLFRSRYDHSEKRNLLIFVTARLVDPAGRALKMQQDMAGARAAEPTGNAGGDAVSP